MELTCVQSAVIGSDGSDLMRREVANGVKGLLPPCAKISQNWRQREVIEAPDCVLQTFQVYRDTAYYFGIDSPYSLRKLFGGSLIAAKKRLNVLPDKCHTCSKSNYKVCDHKEAYIETRSHHGETNYCVRCVCGLSIDSLTESMMKQLKLLQPVVEAGTWAPLKRFGRRSL